MELETTTTQGPAATKELNDLEKLEIDALDLYDEENKLIGEPTEDMKDLLLDHSQLNRVLKISNQLSSKQKEELA